MRLIITRMPVGTNTVETAVIQDEGRTVEMRLKGPEKPDVIGNVYVAKVENVAAHIGAAFVQILPGVRCYLQLNETGNAVFCSPRGNQTALRPGDEILVQVNKEAVRTKLPSVTCNISIPGRYLVLTTGSRIKGVSQKIHASDTARLKEWLAQKGDLPFGLIIRTNAVRAGISDLEDELDRLKAVYERMIRDAKSRTCFSLIYQAEPFYMEMMRSIPAEELQDILTDLPECYSSLSSYAERTGDPVKLSFYKDDLLPLYKLCSLETTVSEILNKKVWLKSGGFLVIEPTEAFVSIDVNSGKFEGRKGREETYQKINLEAAAEIVRQIRLRNLSGIILVDFINTEIEENRERLFHILKEYLKTDSLKCKAIDITPLHIFEMTRKKTRRPLADEIRELM